MMVMLDPTIRLIHAERLTQTYKEGNPCTFGIDTRSPEPTFTTFISLWHAAVAVDAMCIRNGVKGIAFDLGKSYRVTSPRR